MSDWTAKFIRFALALKDLAMYFGPTNMRENPASLSDLCCKKCRILIKNSMVKIPVPNSKDISSQGHLFVTTAVTLITLTLFDVEPLDD